MGRLLDDLLTLARTSRAKLTIGPVDLSAMAHETLARLRAAAPERQLVSEISPGIVAHGGSSLLRTALENLLANAWKFTERNPAARLEFSAERIDGELVCHVPDNGLGFDMAHAALLFMPFSAAAQQR